MNKTSKKYYNGDYFYKVCRKEKNADLSEVAKQILALLYKVILCLAKMLLPD